MTWSYSVTGRSYWVFGVWAVNSVYTGKDLTFLRGAPTIVEQLTYADPFSDATAVLRFPSITGFDPFDKFDEEWFWLTPFNPIVIYLWEATKDQWWDGEQLIVNPDTGKRDLYLHVLLNPALPIPEQNENLPNPYVRNAIWEGFMVSHTLDRDGLSVELQGSFYQMDRFNAMPMYPVHPWPVERLIKRSFDYNKALNIWPFEIEWPAGWTKTYSSADYENKILKPAVVNDGDNWTGITSRNTGGWEQTLTGFVQANLAIMYTTEDSGVNPGDQWTVLNHPTKRRTPLLKVRQSLSEADYYVWYGQPGVDCRFQKDGNSAVNVIFGSGKGYDGTEWMGMQIDGAGITEWIPLAYDTAPDGTPYWPYKGAMKAARMWPSERYSQFPPGLDQGQAGDVAEQWIKRDKNPGWTGEVTLQVDPLDSNGDPFTKWNIRPGQILKIKGFSPWPLDTHAPADGWNFHIAEVTMSPQQGTVSLRVDSKFRDLLTIEEMQARTRDPLTPVKALRVNSRSVLQDDLLYPWNYGMGAGSMPKFSVDFHKQRDQAANFPYETETVKTGCNPGHFFNGGTPKSQYQIDDDYHPSEAWYVAVHAGAANADDRWAFFPMLTSQAGTIRRTEMCAYKADGTVAQVEFHMSIYSFPFNINANPVLAMPRPIGNNTQHSPFYDGAFQTINPATGLKYLQEELNANMPSIIRGGLIIGWGSLDSKAGYSPYSQQTADAPTGMLTDEGTWSFDNVSGDPGKINPAKYAQVNGITPDQIMLGVALYCEDTSEGDWVYFMGRCYKQVAGV